MSTPSTESDSKIVPRECIIYCKLGNIKGSVSEASHLGWMQINSFQFGTGRGVGRAQPPKHIRAKQKAKEEAKKARKKAKKLEKKKAKRAAMLEELKKKCETEGKEYVEPPEEEEKDEDDDRGGYGYGRRRGYGDDDDEDDDTDIEENKEDDSDEDYDDSGIKRDLSAPSVSEVTITRKLDDVSPLLFFDAVSNKLGAECIVHFCKEVPAKDTTGNKDSFNIETYYEFVLSNCLISGYSQSADSESRRPNRDSNSAPSESISLNFTRMAQRAVNSNNKNNSTYIYDIIREKASELKK